MNGTATQYRYHGSVLISQVTGSNKLLFSYDANGNAVAVNYNGTYYYYVRNGQNDVIRLIDGSNNTVVEYTYDSWGRLLSCTGSLASTLGTQNPFRYRGYVYDTETGLYYLQTRYYDPEVGRFINADIYVSTGQGVLGNNMYAYCANGPIARYDVDGLFIDAVFDIVSLCFSIADVIANPTDPLAWAGLAVDVVCLVTPGLTGGGTFVRAVGKIDDVADVVKTANKVDNVVDTAKTAKKIHGNSLKTTKETIGYALKKTDTGEIMKYGETTRGVKRYSQRFYRENGVDMVELARGSKYDMHYWQHNQIVSYYNQYGHRPPWNKSFW